MQLRRKMHNMATLFVLYKIEPADIDCETSYIYKEYKHYDGISTCMAWKCKITVCVDRIFIL